jgi:hypothetical protein
VNYTNDNTDKKQRQQQYFLKVYLFPFLAGVVASFLVYFLTNYFKLNKTDKTTGYIISVIIVLVFWFKNKSRWLPLPDGSHFHINEQQVDSQINHTQKSNEPLEYDAVFRISKIDQAILIFCGIVAIVFGFRMFKNESIIFPLFIIALGLFVLVQGYKGFIDREPKLKLSRKGLWTPKLGFQAWREISKTKVVKEKSSRSTQVYLEIYLKNGEFADTDFPDERLSLFGLEKKGSIEKLIDQFKSS